MDRFFRVALGLVTRGEEGKTLARRLAANGCHVVGLAAEDDKVRSYTANLVMLDEAARVPDEVWRAIEPTLATTDGELIVASTPEGFGVCGGMAVSPKVRTSRSDRPSLAISANSRTRVNHPGGAVFF